MSRGKIKVNSQKIKWTKMDEIFLGIGCKGGPLHYSSSRLALAKNEIVKKISSLWGNRRKKGFRPSIYIQILHQLTSTGFCLPSVLGGSEYTCCTQTYLLVPAQDIHFFYTALSFECTSKLCINFLNQFSV